MSISISDVEKHQKAYLMFEKGLQRGKCGYIHNRTLWHFCHFYREAYDCAIPDLTETETQKKLAVEVDKYYTYYKNYHKDNEVIAGKIIKYAREMLREKTDNHIVNYCIDKIIYRETILESNLKKEVSNRFDEADPILNSFNDQIQQERKKQWENEILKDQRASQDIAKPLCGIKCTIL